MMVNRIQAAILVMLIALFTVPSLAYPGVKSDVCYKAGLYYGDTKYGEAKLIISDDTSVLEVEIRDFISPGLYNIEIFKDYYSAFVAGDLLLDEMGNGEVEYYIPYLDNEFTIQINNDDYSIVSREWVECEMPEKTVEAKVSPQTLNLNSKGKWVTVKITFPTDPEPSEFKVKIGDSESLSPVSIKIAPNHIMLKFSRSELAVLCTEGTSEIRISFKVGEETIELSDIIKVINEGNQGATPHHQANNRLKLKNGKLKGKNNGK